MCAFVSVFMHTIYIRVESGCRCVCWSLMRYFSGSLVHERRQPRLRERIKPTQLGREIFEGLSSSLSAQLIEDDSSLLLTQHLHLFPTTPSSLHSQMASLVFLTRDQLSRIYPFDGDDGTLSFLYHGVRVSVLTYDDAFKWSRWDQFWETK